MNTTTTERGMRAKLKMVNAMEKESSITRRVVFTMGNGKMERLMVWELCIMPVVILLIMVNGRTRCSTAEASYTTITPSPTRTSSPTTSAISKKCGLSTKVISNMMPKMVLEPCTW